MPLDAPPANELAKSKQLEDKIYAACKSLQHEQLSNEPSLISIALKQIETLDVPFAVSTIGFEVQKFETLLQCVSSRDASPQWLAEAQLRCNTLKQVIELLKSLEAFSKPAETI